jgi:hypothetical protein
MTRFEGLTDRERGNMNKRALERFNDLFDLQEVLEQYESFFIEKIRERV